ncbi:MAG TPA: UDP-N-acetylmuramoyl-tripeptide--D-alanyl-D-alanine ligase [Holophagaceae bacterium]|nr:UDP-N-acetylmuramoyl-tripeptide--D-alanyl-D-alanine ligase [Holophagaceae bacterium]
MSDGFSLGEAAAFLGAHLHGAGDPVPSALSLDTRTIQPGECFVALRAERDGHAFAAQAVAQGAGCLLVDQLLDLPVPQLVVPDTLAALQAWGQARLAAVRPRAVFGITGSVGKTSTKELLASAVSGWKTPGNRNNTLGLPQALATMPAGQGAAVLEMGMSTPGEIRRLTEIAPLDFGLVTMVGTAHLENFPEGQEGIARAKGELVAGLRPGGAWTHLSTDPWCAWIARQPWAAHTLAVPVGPGSEFGWEGWRSRGPLGEAFTLRTPEHRLPVEIRLRGEHQVRNAALAATVALLAGWKAEDVVAGLAKAEPEWGRGRLTALQGGGWLLDESYNASPDSILACGASLLELEGGEPVAVLGAMRELGDTAEAAHRRVGEGLRALGVKRLLAFGEHAGAYAEAFGTGARAFPDFESLRDDEAGLSTLSADARVLVKGSRFYRTERAVEWLQSHLA